MDVDELEKQHFLKVLAVFKLYSKNAFKKIQTQISQFEKLSNNQKRYLPDFMLNMKKLQHCVDVNADFISLILSSVKAGNFEGDHFLVNQNEAIETVLMNGNDMSKYRIISSDFEKVHSVLKQFVRDWSIAGEHERNESYEPILLEIKQIFWNSKKRLSDIKILVPGSGLGRLAWELASCGFSCQGNEWSLYMLIPAYFILNSCKQANQATFHPWITQFSNNLTRDNQTASVTVPDVVPSDLPADVQFSMVAGDFTEVYQDAESWDCVTTVYFIDTARNILDYLETIWNILVPGGYWVNFGPLLYHFADVPGQDSIEISYAEVKTAARIIGFEIVKEKENIPSTFTQDSRSMLQFQYRCVLSVFRKPVKAR